MGVVIGASVAGSFDRVTRRSEKQIARIGKAVEAAEKRAGDIEGYRRLQQRTAAVGSAFAAAARRAGGYAAELESAERPAQELRAAHGRAQREVRELGDALRRSNEDLARHRERLGGAASNARSGASAGRCAR